MSTDSLRVEAAGAVVNDLGELGGEVLAGAVHLLHEFVHAVGVGEFRGVVEGEFVGGGLGLHVAEVDAGDLEGEEDLGGVAAIEVVGEKRFCGLHGGEVDGFRVLEQRQNDADLAVAADAMVIEAVVATAEGGGAALYAVKLDVLAAGDLHDTFGGLHFDLLGSEGVDGWRFDFRNVGGGGGRSDFGFFVHFNTPSRAGSPGVRQNQKKFFLISGVCFQQVSEGSSRYSFRR
jgi:hypothetical protein